jgi:hypothetical protein
MAKPGVYRSQVGSGLLEVGKVPPSSRLTKYLQLHKHKLIFSAIDWHSSASLVANLKNKKVVDLLKLN